MTEQDHHIVIAGGGPGGLLAAILFNDLGLKTTVLERFSEPDQWSTKSYSIVLAEKGIASLQRAGCLDEVMAAGMDRNCVMMMDGNSGKVTTIPKKIPGIGLSRPILVECLERKANDASSNVTLKRGSGVSNVSYTQDSSSLVVHLDDGTNISATHVVGADGKWSKVRQSFDELDRQATLAVEPSFGVHVNVPNVPDGWSTVGTYVCKPSKAPFYLIVAPIPNGELSLSMVCNDETVEQYPFLTPPDDMKPADYGKDGFKDEYSAMPKNEVSDISEQLANLFQETMPAFYNAVDRESFNSARVNRKVSWLQMTPEDDENEEGVVTYATADGRVVLIGDAAHAVTPSMGEGCNMALESAVKLADSISLNMNDKQMSTSEALSAGFLAYGKTRPTETRPIQEKSAAGSRRSMKR